MKRIKTFESFQVNENGEDLYTKIRKVIQNTITSPVGFYYLEGIEDAVGKIVDIAFEEGLEGEYDMEIEEILNHTLKKEDKDGYLIEGKDEATAKIVSLLTGEDFEERPNSFNDISDLRPGGILPDEPEHIKAADRKRNAERELGRW